MADSVHLFSELPRQTCRLCPARDLCTRSLTEPRELTLRPKAEYQALQTARQQQNSTDWKKGVAELMYDMAIESQKHYLK